MVMGDNSCSKGRGFKSCAIYWMDIFSHWFVVKIVLFVSNDRKQMKKRPELAHYLKKTLWLILINAEELQAMTKQWHTIT